jgi:hypothetical protein
MSIRMSQIMRHWELVTLVIVRTSVILLPLPEGED